MQAQASARRHHAPTPPTIAVSAPLPLLSSRPSATHVFGAADFIRLTASLSGGSFAVHLGRAIGGARAVSRTPCQAILGLTTPPAPVPLPFIGASTSTATPPSVRELAGAPPVGVTVAVSTSSSSSLLSGPNRPVSCITCTGLKPGTGVVAAGAGATVGECHHSPLQTIFSHTGNTSPMWNFPLPLTYHDRTPLSSGVPPGSFQHGCCRWQRSGWW
jgi:hypothetical protein